MAKRLSNLELLQINDGTMYGKAPCLPPVVPIEMERAIKAHDRERTAAALCLQIPEEYMFRTGATLAPEAVNLPSEPDAIWRWVPWSAEKATPARGPDARSILISEMSASAFQLASPDYHGVLASSSAGRLAISPNGSRYNWQAYGGNGSWLVKSWAKSLAKLAASVSLPADLPFLPDDPNEYDRFWHTQSENNGRRLRALNESAPDYAGVISTDGKVRLIVRPFGQQYVVQVLKPRGWENSRYCDTALHVVAAIARHGRNHRPIEGVTVKSDKLHLAALMCPSVPLECPFTPEPEIGRRLGDSLYLPSGGVPE